MVSTNKYILLDSFSDLCTYFFNGNVNNPFTFYSSKFVIHYESFPYPNTEDLTTDDQRSVARRDDAGGSLFPYASNSFHSIRIWKSNTLFNSWYNDNNDSSFVAAFDYQIRTNDIKIEYLSVNDDECHYKNKPIDLNSARILHKELLNYLKKVAKEENKQRIIVDVHENLRIYNKDYKDSGFEITGRNAKDNPFWKEIEFKISNDESNK